MYFIGVNGFRVLPLLINGWMDGFYFYDSAVGAKRLENDRERSWRWRERSRAFLQERSTRPRRQTLGCRTTVSDWKQNKLTTEEYVHDAMCCGQDPSVINERSTARKPSIHFEHGLPRPGTTCRPPTVDDVWTDVCDVRRTTTTHCVQQTMPRWHSTEFQRLTL